MSLRLATLKNVSIKYKVHDLADLKPNNKQYDTIFLVFLHLPPDIRTQVHHNLVKLLKPGGEIVVEAFSKKQLGRTSGGPQVPGMLYDEEILKRDFRDLEIKELYEKVDFFKEGLYHQGEAALIRMRASKSS
jgi:hypothetical protein